MGVKVGILGAGVIGRSHARALSYVKLAELAAVADPADGLAEKLGREHRCAAFTSLKDMLDSVDAVFVCTPSNLHAANALEAIAAAKHVFLEKPITLTLAESDSVIGAAHRTGVRLMVGQVIRYFPAIAAMKRVLEAGDLGDLVAAWSHRYHNTPLRGHPAWRWDPKIGGGFVLEWLIHEIDTVRYMGGDVAAIYARVARTDHEHPDFDVTVHSVFDLRNGGTGTVSGSLAHAMPYSERGVMGTSGTAIAKDAGTLVVRALDGGEERVISAPERLGGKDGPSAAMVTEDEEFVNAIIEGRAPSIPGEEGRADLEVALAIHKSATENRLVELPL